jgi:hypothetical protein
MNRTPSIFPLFAVLLVFLFHASYGRFKGFWTGSIGDYGHDRNSWPLVALMRIFVHKAFKHGHEDDSQI